MAADVATLSLKLEASQFVDGMARAKAATEGLTRSQTELIARADKLVASANTIDIQNKKAVQTYLQEVAALRATAQQMGVLHLVQETTAKAAADVTSHVVAETQAMKVLRAETGLLAAEQKVLGAATGLSRGGLNTLRESATSLASSLVGLAPGVGTFSSALGTMALGSGLMIGVLAGVAALGFAWDKLTEKARKAKEEHERLIKVLDDLRKKQDQGPAGDIGVATAVRTKDLADQIALVRRLEKEKADLAKLGGADVETSGVSRRLTAARAELINLQDLVRRGNAETAALRKADRDQTAQADAQALAARLEFNQKDAAARKAALALLAKDRAEYARLMKLPDSPENSKEIARVAADIRQLDQALHPKSSGSGKPPAAKDMEAILAALQAVEEQAERTAEARTRAVGDATARTQQELAEAELLLRAIQESEDAYKAQQREIAILNQLTAEGIRLGDADYELQKKRLEQLYDTRAAIDAVATSRSKETTAGSGLARDDDRRSRQLQRATANAIEQGITDAANGQNPGRALGNMVKSAMIRGISEALAQKFLASKFAEMLGIGDSAASKQQNEAARKMEAAAQKQKEAADIMLRAAGFDPDNTKDGGLPPWVGTAVKWAKVAVGSAVAGYATGQALSSTSHGTTGNLVRGAVGGAVSGAAAGAAVAGLPGAIAGAVVGFVSGMFGASKAMKEAAKAAAEMRAALKINMDALRADVGKDALAANIAQVEAQREQLRKQIEDAYSGGDKNSATVKERNKQLAELNRLEDTRIRQLREEAAVMQARQIEDFKVRELRASGKTKEADALAFQLAQRREREDLVRSFGDVVDATEQSILAAYDAAAAAEKNASALDRNTAALTTLHNAPTGYKVEADIYRFATPAPRPEPKTPIAPTAPTPPQQPVATPPQLSRAPITIAPVFQIDGTKSSREQVRQIASELRKVVTETLGPAADTSAGWDLLA